LSSELTRRAVSETRKVGQSGSIVDTNLDQHRWRMVRSIRL